MHEEPKGFLWLIALAAGVVAGSTTHSSSLAMCTLARSTYYSSPLPSDVGANTTHTAERQVASCFQEYTGQLVPLSVPWGSYYSPSLSAGVLSSPPKTTLSGKLHPSLRQKHATASFCLRIWLLVFAVRWLCGFELRSWRARVRYIISLVR